MEQQSKDSNTSHIGECFKHAWESIKSIPIPIYNMNNMEDNRHYVPDASDIYPGYEYEFNGKKENYQSVGEWVKQVAGTEPEECSILDQHGTKDGIPTNWYIEQGWIRVPYLTKEQIEELGWEKVEETDMRIVYNKDVWELDTWKDDTWKYISLYTDAVDCRYEGECKDKNTLQYLMKLLKIQ